MPMSEEFSYFQNAILWVFLPIAQWALVMLLASSVFASIFIIFGGLFKDLSK